MRRHLKNEINTWATRQPGDSIEVKASPGPSVGWVSFGLTTKAFFQGLGNNWDYVQKHDCFTRFMSRVADDYVPGAGAPSLDDLVRQGSAGAAAAYQMSQGLTVPMRSSVFRGILSGGEKLAGWVAVSEFIKSELNSLGEEYGEIQGGTCKGW